MGEKKIFSIVTPSFNQGDFIADTIESIIDQEGNFFIDYQIIDGSSSDQTINIIKNFESKIKQSSIVLLFQDVEFYKYGKCAGIAFRWISEKDKGQSDAINKGFEKSVGDFFNWINSDDQLLPHSLKLILNKFEDKKINVVYGGCIAVDAQKKELWRHNPPEVTVYNLLYKGEGVPQPSVFWRKILTKQRSLLVDNNLKYTMDTDLWLYFFKSKYRFERIEADLSSQIYHENSKSCEGEVMFEKFQPENDRIKSDFRKNLGIDHYYFLFLKKLEVLVPVLFKIFKKLYYY